MQPLAPWRVPLVAAPRRFSRIDFFRAQPNLHRCRAAGCVASNATRGPIRSARELSLSGIVVLDKRRPPTSR